MYVNHLIMPIDMHEGWNVCKFSVYNPALLTSLISMTKSNKKYPHLEIIKIPVYEKSKYLIAKASQIAEEKRKQYNQANQPQTKASSLLHRTILIR